ncbi:hypothetical protein [Peribacillus loiseleuriae]|uniref:Uncharacterized protein n=1 Tax=Peribacillus loiseleuriae TaxID=1679170 RepID=A0A0K9G5K8_9BACI|nr:hypothetical protein [Peribacillus loiseleuriae]KMY41492.1 hypothetical protein AC625_24735 [Peribacillus loiseleuriae]
MPVTFTPTTPIQYVEFDFEGYFDSLDELFGHLSFFSQWKQFWLTTFLKLDKEVKVYMEKFPNSNPIIQRIKHQTLIPDERYEMFEFEHITDFGSYYFHFDIEKMKEIKNRNLLSTERVHLNYLYVDPTTPIIKNKLQDQRLPFFVRMFGVEKSFICADGNKRIRTRMEEGQTEFEGYVFYPQDLEEAFFGPLDFFYYIHLYEMELMYREMEATGGNEQSIYKVTQLYLQANQK